MAITVEELKTRIGRLDHVLAERAADQRGTRADDAAHLLSAAADRSKIWVGWALLRALTDRRNGRRAAVRAVATIVIATVLIDIGKKRIGRDRPARELALRFGVRPQTSASFPSGHAASAAIAATLLTDGRPRWRLPLWTLAVSVAWSRVQVGLHHTSDVIGGFAIGLVIGRIVRRLVPLRPPES